MVEERLFRHDDVDEIVELMDELADGSGWLVLDGAVHEDDMPPAPGILGLFTAKGPEAPELSWVPGEPGGRRVEPLSVGIRHASGPKAKRTLAEAGHPVPDGWLVVQDNPKRGLVAQVRDGSTNAEVLDWLLRAAAILATVPMTGTWRARIYLR